MAITTVAVTRPEKFSGFKYSPSYLFDQIWNNGEVPSDCIVGKKIEYVGCVCKVEKILKFFCRKQH